MTILLVLAMFVPGVMGNCCMPKNFAARTFSVEGPLGEVIIYVDFPSKQLTVMPAGDDNVLRGLVIDFGAGFVYKHSHASDTCIKSRFTDLKGFDRCIPKDAKGNAKVGYFQYKLTSGMRVDIAVDKSNCYPFYFQLSDPSNSDWIKGITWVGLVEIFGLNMTAPYVKQSECSDDNEW